MKLTTLVLLAAFLQVSAATFAQKVTLAQKRATLAQIFTAIHEQTGYNVLWSGSELKGLSTQDVNFKDTPFRVVLDEVLKDQPLTYEVQDQTILIKKKQVSVSEKPADPPVNAPPVTVTGKVVDELGNPMVGVTVKQKDKPTNATATDAKGNYALNVTDNNNILVFSFIGYETQELAAKDIVPGSVITMKATATSLREVVIDKGYYKERRELSTGDVGIVSAKELAEQPVTDPLLMLEGKVPGLYISQASGVPGAYSVVRVMGQNSINNGNDPLYIVDGFPFNSVSPSNPNTSRGPYNTPTVSGYNQFGYGLSPFNLLDPSTIESIEVLKDADATAIYGSRGANGVVLITTKKGKTGDTRVSFNLSQGAGKVTRLMPMMNTQQYIQMREQGLRNDGVSPSFGNGDYDLTDWDTTRNTDWQKVLVGNTANYTNANLSLSGGNTNTQFLIGGTFSRQGSVYFGNYADAKSSGYVNINHHSTNQRFEVQLNVAYTHDYNNEPSIDLESQAITLAPNSPALYNSDGSLNWGIYQGTPTFNTNPLSYEQQTFTATSNQLVTGLNLSYQLSPGLKFQSVFGYTSLSSQQQSLTPGTSIPPIYVTPSFRNNSTSNNAFSSWSIEPQLNYNKKINHSRFEALIGTSFQSNSINDLLVNASGFATDPLIVNPTVASTIHLSGVNSLYRYNAIYARLNYNLDDKYLLNITGRRDGSSRFGPGKQWGNFGSVGAGWLFSKEKSILDNLSWLSFGKLRASYGITGNDQIGNYGYLSTYNGNSVSYQGQSVLSPSALTNPYYSWEHVKKLQAGIDLGFFGDRINATATWYRNRDDDQLVLYALPYTTGFTSIVSNFPANVQNTGWEFTLNTQNIVKNKFQWTSSFNLTLPQNKLLAYPNIQNSSYKLTYAVGQSLFSHFLYNYTGVSPQTGLYTFSTQNANGLPGANDYVISKPITQSAYGALSNSFRYKDLQLDVMLQFVKQNSYNYLKYIPQPGVGYGGNNEPTYLLNAWQNPGDNSSVQKYSEGYSSISYTAYADMQRSNVTISDASFIRLKNVELSYNLRANGALKRIFQTARIYVQAENLLTFTGYQGIDPETQGVALPPLRMITAGLQVTF